MADPTPREQLAALKNAETASGTRALPKIPYHPPPKDVLARVPSLGPWYEEWHRKMDDWRQQADRAIRGSQM